MRTSAEEHRRLKQRKNIKQELILTISVYELDIYIYIVEKINSYRILFEKLKKMDYFEEVGVDGRMILKGILKKKDGKTLA